MSEPNARDLSFSYRLGFSLVLCENGKVFLRRGGGRGSIIHAYGCVVPYVGDHKKLEFACRTSKVKGKKGGGE